MEVLRVKAHSIKELHQPIDETEHLTLAWQSQARGELILAGVVADPVDGAVLLFRADSPKIVEAFVAADPYVKNGLVTQWRVRPWNTVVGEDASNPVRP